MNPPTVEQHEKKNQLLKEAREILDIDNKDPQKIAIAGSWKRFHITGYLYISLFNCKDINHVVKVFRSLNKKYQLPFINISFYSKYREGLVVSKEKIKEVTIRKGKH